VHAGGKLVQNYFLHEWKRNLQAEANGKLCSYVLFKSNFGCEKYLSVINNMHMPQCYNQYVKVNKTLTTSFIILYITT
jgi:hypothetical protein